MNCVNASPFFTRGISLLEVLLAQSLGLLAAGSMLTLFYHTQSVIVETSLVLQLENEVSKVVHQFKHGLRNAGYHRLNHSALVISGENEVISVLVGDESAIGGVALMGEGSGDNERQYRFFKVDDQGYLKLCEKRSDQALNREQVIKSGYLGACYSIFDPKFIRVKSFTVKTLKSAKKTIWLIEMVATLVRHPHYEYDVAFTLTALNQ